MKTVKLSEEAYNKLKEKIIKEISYGTVDRAYDKSDDVFWEMKSAFMDFYSTVEYNKDTSNPYVRKIKAYADAIYGLLEMKTDQGKRFHDETNKVDHNKFYDSDDAIDNDIDDMDLNYLQKNYNKQ